MNKILTVFYLFWAPFLGAQNQLPLANGEFEDIEPGTSNFSYWTNLQTNGGQANYSIETENLIPGSSKAQKSQIISLGSNGWHVKTHSDYLFQVEAGQTYTVRFWAKVSGNSNATMKVVFQSEVSGSYQGNNKTITQNWQQFAHTFSVTHNSDLNRLSFWYMDAGVTYFLDEVEVVVGSTISLNQDITYQTVDGFGAGIKRRTEHLYALNDVMRNQIESYAFQELEPNMIRFFVYHDLEDPNDNNNPFNLNESALDWTRYDSDPNSFRTRYVAEALNNAFDLSSNGFDHVIGNCNSAPAWLKTNGSHTNGGTLITGGEDEFSEFLIGFLNGMQSRYGIMVNAISPTNEPDFQVSYESMNTTPDQLANIISNLDNRLISENLSDVKIISPETFRVNSTNSNTSTVNYINSMFNNPDVVSATDIVATHTYQSSITPTDWAALKIASHQKPIWVTEAGNLHSPDFDMYDASYHIERIMDGFNYGGLTAYMLHLFYEKHDYINEVNPGDNYGSSALVLWDSNLNIILPKRYYVFKHFANLVKKDYERIHVSSFSDDLKVLAFKSPDESKIVVHLFSYDNILDFDLEIPNGTTSIINYVTSDLVEENFNIIPVDNLSLSSDFINLDLDALSMRSIVFNIDPSLGSNNISPENNHQLIRVYPNPTKSRLEISFPNQRKRDVSIFQANGVLVYSNDFPVSNKIEINVESLSPGVYILKSNDGTQNQVVKFIIKN